MKILHISNDFCLTKVHSNLYQALDALDINQTIFNPVRDAALVGRNFFEGQHTDIIYAHVVKPWHRYTYHLKRRQVFREMIGRINPKDYTLTHATTLLTDGGLAYQLYKHYGTPYIVTVRDADINGFLRHLPHTWMDARRILLHAEKIIFISEAQRRQFVQHIAVRDIIPQIEERFILMSNGIDNYYLDHVQHQPHSGHGIVYVGRFSTRKNVVRLAKAVLLLREKPGFEDCTLTLIGGGRAVTDEMERMLAQYPQVFQYVEPVFEQKVMCELFAKAKIFAMPSLHETFGLVYIEALSQNLPVLYTRGQGVDGLLPPSAGLSVNPFSIEEIAEALAVLVENKGDYYTNADIDFSLFRWNHIAHKYVDIYNGLERNH